MGQTLGTMHDFDDSYVYEEKLGEGAFGKVYKVRHKGTNNFHALKVIKCGSNEDLEGVEWEMKAMGKLDHPNIMKLFGTKYKEREVYMAELYLIFEYCPGGTLAQRLEKFSSKDVNVKWMSQLANAISYLHSMNLVHRDLKPDNILLNSFEDIKVGDFGLSRDFVAMKRPEQTWESYYMDECCGTLFYMAPEMFVGHYTDKADVFAMGILFYAIEERGFIEVNGMTFYGVFVLEKDGNKVPLGLQMQTDKTCVNINFSETNEHLARIIGSALLLDPKRRSTAADIKKQLENYSVTL